MKEKILALRAQGLSYQSIVDKLKCSKGLVAYHCGDGQKEKSRERLFTSRRRRKEYFVKKFGGKCCQCGYNKCIDALEFHHTDPSVKDGNISDIMKLNADKAEKELVKCILVCANCHREFHATVV